jgi:hypothetical protein
MGRSNAALKVEIAEPETISEELAIIQELNGGLINPIQVVEYARNPNTLLHKKFEWEDSVAAEKYRVWQARKIISLELIVIKEDINGKMQAFTDVHEEGGRIVRAFISLADDRRSEDERGYRSVIDVMSDEQLREKMLEEARNDMRLFRRKYESLSALSKVFEAMSQV